MAPSHLPPPTRMLAHANTPGRPKKTSGSSRYLSVDAHSSLFSPLPSGCFWYRTSSNFAAVALVLVVQLFGCVATHFHELVAAGQAPTFEPIPLLPRGPEAAKRRTGLYQPSLFAPIGGSTLPLRRPEGLSPPLALFSLPVPVPSGSTSLLPVSPSLFVIPRELPGPASRGDNFRSAGRAAARHTAAVLGLYPRGVQPEHLSIESFTTTPAASSPRFKAPEVLFSFRTGPWNVVGPSNFCVDSSKDGRLPRDGLDSNRVALRGSLGSLTRHREGPCPPPRRNWYVNCPTSRVARRLAGVPVHCLSGARKTGRAFATVSPSDQARDNSRTNRLRCRQIKGSKKKERHIRAHHVRLVEKPSRVHRFWTVGTSRCCRRV